MRRFILIIIVLAAFVGIGVYVYQSKELVNINVFEGASQSSLSKNEPPYLAPPEGYIKYENKKYGFSYYHSPEASVKEYDEGGGAETIVEEGSKQGLGLQIFIMPYHEEKISEERFKEDVPTGVRLNEKTINFGRPDTEALTFDSSDPTLGETKEVWFIRGGYLYEITVPKTASEVLQHLLETAHFNW